MVFCCVGVDCVFDLGAVLTGDLEVEDTEKGMACQEFAEEEDGFKDPAF